jgi:hypothetical protein
LMFRVDHGESHFANISAEFATPEGTFHGQPVGGDTIAGWARSR